MRKYIKKHTKELSLILRCDLEERQNLLTRLRRGRVYKNPCLRKADRHTKDKNCLMLELTRLHKKDSTCL